MALIKIQSYSLLGAIQDNKTVLGGSAGSGGGVGDPPAGFVGQLTQSNVTFDTAGSSRACSAGSAGSSSLVDNLDAIRLGLEICDDAIQERHLDWGFGANQISAVDVPFATTSGSISATNVRDAIEEAWLHGTGGSGVTDHGALTGLADDDHTQYLLADGTRALSGAWDVGAFEVTFGAGIAFDGASGANPITIPDGAAIAMHIMDDGGVPVTFFEIDTVDNEIVFNPGEVDVDVRFAGLGATNLFYFRGSDGHIALGGPSMTVPNGWEFQLSDNNPAAIRFIDLGDASDYLTFVTTDGSREVVVNQDAHANIDFRVEGVGHSDALVVQGSDGQVTLGALGAGVVQSTAAGVLSSSTVITVPDNVAQALNVVDDGGVPIEYVRIVSTDAQPVVVFNNGEADVDFRIAADAGVVLGGDPTYAFMVDGAIGTIGMGAAPSATQHLLLTATVSTTAHYYGLYNTHTKTAGVTDTADTLYGHRNQIAFNQAGGILGYVYALYNVATLTDGTVGSAANDRVIGGVLNRIQMDGGVAYGEVIAGKFIADINAGTVHTDGLGRVIGVDVFVDTEAAATIAHDVYGARIRVDEGAGCGGTVYMLYLWEGVGVDYGIYQSGTAPSWLQGRLAVGGTVGALAQLHVDQSAAGGAIPVALFDQADLSEEFFEFTTTVGAGNPIDTAAIGAYYGKVRVMVTGVGYKVLALYEES